MPGDPIDYAAQSVGAKSGQKKPSAGGVSGPRRFALIAFAVLLVGLFISLALAEGLGPPSVPSGDVAVVEDIPGDIGNVTKEEFDRSLAQQAAQGGQKTPPKEGSDKYEELKNAAMTELLEQVWLRAEAEELGISVTPKQVSAELAQIKEQNFKAPGSYQEFLKNSSFTPEDVQRRVEVQVLSGQIQENVGERAGQASKGEIEAYYEAEKDSQFTSPASRDVRVIINEDKGEVEKAQEALEKDSSPASWNKVAAKYSSDPSTKGKGGLQTGVPEEFLQGELKKAVFETPTNQLAGPVKSTGNYLLVEVVKLNPEKVQSLGEVRSQISSTLTQQSQEEALSEFVAGYGSKWASRTFCADGFRVQNCSNFESDGHPTTAVPACYEANPKVPATECPAPVTQAVPALPGTVTPTQPKGEPFPQRPRPQEAGVTGTTPTEGGAAPPPTGAPPSGSAPPPSGSSSGE